MAKNKYRLKRHLLGRHLDKRIARRSFDPKTNRVIFLCIFSAGDANDELLRKQQELQDMDDEFDMNTTKAQRLVEYMEKCAMFDVREGQATIKRLGAAIESDDEARCRSQEDASETMMRLAYTQELLISVRNEIQRLQTSMAAEAGSSAGTTLTGAREEVLLRLLHNEERSLSDQVTALRQSLAKIDAILIATKEHQEEVERALSWQ